MQSRAFGGAGVALESLVTLHAFGIVVFGFALFPSELHAIDATFFEVDVVEVVDEATRSAKVVVPDYQLSLAIGKDGQNARLAARLTGWRIDIHSDSVSPQG